jgi:hypothetical protein
MIPAPQYTLHEAISVCLAMCQRALSEVRALAPMPGPRGERGEQGKQGPPGDRGLKGETGRNASDLTFLQGYIDERVERAIKAISITSPDSGRTLHVMLGDTVHEIKTAIPIYAGGWKDGVTYNCGDGISVAGSVWIAQTATTAKPPSDDWRLAVRAGRDYRPDNDRPPAKPVRFK